MAIEDSGSKCSVGKKAIERKGYRVRSGGGERGCLCNIRG